MGVSTTQHPYDHAASTGAAPALSDSPAVQAPPLSDDLSEDSEETLNLILAATPPSGAGPESDTLLSAPAPADRWETELEDRLSAARARLEELEARVRALEARALPRPSPVRVPGGLVWVAFLLLLALVFQIFVRLKGD